MTAPATPSNPTVRPGRVVAIEGVTFQCDLGDRLAAPLVRAVERMSWRLRHRSHLNGPPLANHAGIRVSVALPNGTLQAYVVEVLPCLPWSQHAGVPCWTPLPAFRARNRGGWDVTVPAEVFARVESTEIITALAALNGSVQRRHRADVCTRFIERLFRTKPMFSPIEVLCWVSPTLRLPEPAAPHLRPSALLSEQARHLLRTEASPLSTGSGSSGVNPLHGEADQVVQAWHVTTS